ncbi:MAG: hypothetical protein KBA06_04925, partial [Saprospiraceae bacterium]|nr:hypothetical protein [Saprospiraceae bacterium]
MKNNNYSPNVKRQLSNNWFQIALVSVVFMILYLNSSSFHLKIDSAELNSASSSSPSHTNIARAEFPILSLFSFEKETAFNW